MPFLPHDSLIGPLAAGFGVIAGIGFIVLTLWALFWKSLALWHAARNRQKIWFVALLLINTIGILEIVYLVWFRKDNNVKGAHELYGLPDKIPHPASRASSAPRPEEKEEPSAAQ